MCAHISVASNSLIYGKVVGVMMNFYVLAMGLIMVIVYVWSRKNPEVSMTFMFGIRFKVCDLSRRC